MVKFIECDFTKRLTLCLTIKGEDCDAYQNRKYSFLARRMRTTRIYHTYYRPKYHPNKTLYLTKNIIHRKILC